jgi:hypothetical protein
MRTNTLPNGACGGDSAFASCSNWTNGAEETLANVGANNQTGTAWTASTSDYCNNPLRLYCFKQS